MKKNSLVLFLAALPAALFAQGSLLSFDWTSVPAYTHFASTDILEPGRGEIGFGGSNFYIWSNDTASYDTRTHDLLFRIGVIPHMDFGIKYSAPRAVVLDFRGGFEAGRFEFAGSAGFGYMKATRYVVPGNNTVWLYDGYPVLSFGYEAFPWLRFVLSAKGIISHYVRERVEEPENFTTYHAGYAITLDLGTDEWRIRPEYNRYWGVTYYTQADEPTRFKAGSLGIGAVYRPSFKKNPGAEGKGK